MCILDGRYDLWVGRRGEGDLVEVPYLAIGEHLRVAGDEGLHLPVRWNLGSFETAGRKHRDQKIFIGVTLSVQVLGGGIDPFLPGLRNKELAVYQFLKNLRAGSGLIQTSRDLRLLYCKVELGRGYFIAIHNRH
jgi:hypothetical protein